MQHKQGDYYVTDGNDLYVRSGSANKWAKVVLPGTGGWGNTILLANGNGDLLIRQNGGSSQRRYLRRNANAADWTVAHTIPADSEGYLPCYYANNGNVYYSYKVPIDNGVQVRFLNINTGTYGFICDENYPDNSVLVGSGAMNGYIYFDQNGDIYGMDGLGGVYKLSGTNMPNKLVKVTSFAKPVSHDYNWHSDYSLFGIDANGNLKVLGSCNHFGVSETHHFAAAGSLKSSSFYEAQHPYTQSTIRCSLRGGVYLWPYLAPLTHWK